MTAPRRPRVLLLPLLALAGLSANDVLTPERLSARVLVQPSRPGIAAAFRDESYLPNSLGSLKLFGGGRSLAIQIFRAGAERGHTRRRDVMKGLPVSKRLRLGSRKPGIRVGVRIGAWPSGLYFAKLTASGGRVGYAPFVVRPRTLGEHRVAVVMPTQTWQAYNFRDDDRDGRADTWYADASRPHARLARPFLDRGVPPRFRHYDLPFLHWLARTHKHVDFLSDGDLDAVSSGAALAAAYDLIVFPGHHEYVTTHEYDVVTGYRNRGGNLAFLFANDFFWRVVRQGDVMTRTRRWRDLGRPEAQLIGVQYRGNDRGARKGPWIIRRTSGAPWLFAGTGLRRGSRIGSGGIEIDSTAAASPSNVQVLGEIPNLYGPGFSAQMSYYDTPAGAKVFAAGAFDLVESILEPDKALPDPEAERTRGAARRMLENLWAELSKP